MTKPANETNSSIGAWLASIYACREAYLVVVAARSAVAEAQRAEKEAVKALAKAQKILSET